MNINSSLQNNELVQQIYKSALSYSDICNKDYLYVVLDKNDCNNVEIYQAHYMPKMFMHLCGINSKTMSATEFYNNSLCKSLAIEDCTSAYNHSLSQISEKVSILNDLLNIKNMKMFRIDDANVQPQKAEFDIGIGNNTGFIGYRYDKVIMKFVPVTNMPQPLSKYCFDPQKISMAFSKNFEEESYKIIEFEVSKNLLKKLDVQYYYILQDFIDRTLLDKSFSHYFDEEFEAKTNSHDNDLEK